MARKRSHQGSPRFRWRKPPSGGGGRTYRIEVYSANWSARVGTIYVRGKTAADAMKRSVRHPGVRGKRRKLSGPFTVEGRLPKGARVF